MSRLKATAVLRCRIRPTVLGQSAEGYVKEYMKAHTQVTGEVEDLRGDEVVEVGSGIGCPWLSGTAFGDELSGRLDQIIWRSRTLELAVSTVVCASRRIRCSGSTPCIHLMSGPWSSSFL